MPQFTVNLPGGGQMTVNAKDAASAIGNAGGGSIGSNGGGGGAPSAPQPAAPQPASFGSNAQPSSVPAPAGMPSGYNTNNQSDRDTLRSLGYYIDNSGVYAPGAGQRVGDTFSGSMANQNEAPSPTQLPVINGTPISPSNGSTGPQTGAIMYRSDPQYATYFGPGTPGYSSTSRTYNATPTGPENGQQSLMDYLGQQGTQVTHNAMISDSSQSGIPEGSNRAATEANAPANDAWMAGVTGPNANGGFGPYATPAAPVLEDQGQYVQNGQIIKKSVDQFGHTYYQTVGAAPSGTTAPQPAAPAAPQAQPAGQAPANNGKPANDPTNGGALVPLTNTDGSVQYVPKEFYTQYLSDRNALADAKAKAQSFTQGIAQGQLDVQRMVAEGDRAYHDALTAGASAQLAQTALRDAMQNDLAKQTLELNKVIQQQTAAYQQQQIDLQRSQQGQTLSLEREKLDLQRQQLRGVRRLPQVRYA